MNWILIANTTAPKTDYNILVIALVGIIFFVLGFRLADVSIKQRRKGDDS